MAKIRHRLTHCLLTLAYRMAYGPWPTTLPTDPIRGSLGAAFAGSQDGRAWVELLKSEVGLPVFLFSCLLHISSSLVCFLSPYIIVHVHLCVCLCVCVCVCMCVRARVCMCVCLHAVTSARRREHMGKGQVGVPPDLRECQWLCICIYKPIYYTCIYTGRGTAKPARVSVAHSAAAPVRRRSQAPEAAQDLHLGRR